MPHFIIECSERLLDSPGAMSLMSEVVRAARASELFAEEGPGRVKVRVRAYRHHLTVGGGAEFIHVFAYLMEGRDPAQRRRLSELVVSALRPLVPSVEFLSVSVMEFDRSTYSNKAMQRES